MILIKTYFINFKAIFLLYIYKKRFIFAIFMYHFINETSICNCCIQI